MPPRPSRRDRHQSVKPSRHDAAIRSAGCPLLVTNAHRARFQFTLNQDKTAFGFEGIGINPARPITCSRRPDVTAAGVQEGQTPDADSKAKIEPAQSKSESSGKQTGHPAAEQLSPKDPASSQSADQEKRASRDLKQAKQILKNNPARGKQRLQKIVDVYPGTKAAEEAASLLKGLK